MAELARKTGNFPLFSIDTPSKLTVFGGTTLSTDIDAIVDTDEFKDGWGYLNGTVAPPEQDFNALGYSLSYVASYYLQKGIPEWDGTDGIIGGQEYIADKSYVGYGGEIYVALLASGGSVASRVPTNATYWKKVGSALLNEFEVTGSPATTISLTGLDINLHKSYRIEIDLINSTASTALLYGFVNGDTTVTNYERQILQSSGASTVSSRTNDASIATNGANQKCSMIINLTLNNGYACFNTVLQRGIGTVSNVGEIFFTTKLTTNTNITTIDLTASVAGTIGVGTKVRVYRGDK